MKSKVFRLVSFILAGLVFFAAQNSGAQTNMLEFQPGIHLLPDYYQSEDFGITPELEIIRNNRRLAVGYGFSLNRNHPNATVIRGPYAELMWFVYYCLMIVLELDCRSGLAMY
jgi:hypothetical protein